MASGTEVGGLCRECAQAVTPCDGLIADHIRSNVSGGADQAWLVDGFGSAHAVAAKTTIGRAQDGQFVVLADTVSRQHAELRRTEAGWQVRDLGSHNGTFVDRTRCTGRVTLAGRAVLRFGDVAMWFVEKLAAQASVQPSMATRTQRQGLVRYLIRGEHSELCVVGSSDHTTGGSLLARQGDADWTHRELPPLEFQLLRTLCERANAEADSPAAVRGCVATRQLAADLPFQSRHPDEENVRQVVRRLRGALAEVGGDGVVASVPGRGYYISRPVTIDSAR